jgi:hypothetical protein
VQEGRVTSYKPPLRRLLNPVPSFHLSLDENSEGGGPRNTAYFFMLTGESSYFTTKNNFDLASENEDSSGQRGSGKRTRQKSVALVLTAVPNSDRATDSNHVCLSRRQHVLTRSVDLPNQLEMGEIRPEGGHEWALHPEPEDIFAKTVSLVNSRAYQKAAPFTSAGLIKRLEMIKNAGLPPLRVVRLSTLIELGRIPRSTEGHAVDALQEFTRLDGERPSTAHPDRIWRNGHSHLHAPLIVFFSHRWARPVEGFPDGPDNTKARALIHWAKQELWERRKQTEVLVRGVVTIVNRAVEEGEGWKLVIAHVFLVIQLAIVLVAWAVGNWWFCLLILPGLLLCAACQAIGSRSEACRKAAIKLTGRYAKEVGDEVASHIADLPTEVLFFIDYTCVDQQNPSAEVGAIPAYVSSCSEILAHFDQMYSQRAWCRAELMLAHAFTGEMNRKRFKRIVRDIEHQERSRADNRDCASECGTVCGDICKEYEGGNWISVIQSGVQPGARANRSEELLLLDPTEGHVTEITDMHVITRLKQCAEASSSFTCGVVYQDILSDVIRDIMSRYAKLHPYFGWNSAAMSCWNVAINFIQVIKLPITVVYCVALIPYLLIVFIYSMAFCAPWIALSGKRSTKVGKSHISLRDRHTYQWGYHPWGEGPVEHVHVAAQTFRIGIPPGSVPGQAMSVKVPLGFAQSGQTRVIVVPPLGQAFVDVPLNAADGLPGQGRTLLQVLVPHGMRGGQTLLVQTPSGRMQVVIPPGLKEGEAFQFVPATFSPPAIGPPPPFQSGPPPPFESTPPPFESGPHPTGTGRLTFETSD